MNSNKGGRAPDVLLLINGLFFLLMGFMDLGRDQFGVGLGFGVGVPLCAVYLWRKLRRIRGKGVKIGRTTGLLFGFSLFFLMLGLTGITDDREAVLVGFVPGVPLTALYLWHRIREYRSYDRQPEVPAAVEVMPLRVAPPAGEKTVPVTICPHCGAPGRGTVCEYCGMAKTE